MGLLSGLLAGFLLGLGARMAMSVIALAAHQEPRFNLGGSLEVLATGILIGLPAGLVFVALRHYIPGSAVWKGATFGLLLFLTLVLVPPPAARSATTAVGQQVLTLVLFGVLFVGFGILVEILVQRLLPQEQPEDDAKDRTIG